ncbi:MAG: hypothetical protein HY580_04680, partial [Nitrospinae bacterium]|nr:hypothetical protein [Nitrospinota bacterium]
MITKLRMLLTAIVLLAAAPDPARALPPEPASKTSGTVFPHILKTETYELNARNIKVLKAHGKTLWMGTSMGVVAYDTTTAGDYQ